MEKNIIPVFTDEAFTGASWFHNMLAGAKACAAQYHLRSQLFIDEHDSAALLAGLPKNVIVTGSSHQTVRHMIDRLEATGKRIILAGHDAQQFGYHTNCATMSRQADMELLIRYFKSCGRTRLALYGFWRSSSNDMIRYQYTQTAAAGQGIRLTQRDLYFWSARFSECDAFWENHTAYDAVICPTDIIAVRFLAQARERGVQVPGQLYVAGSSDQLIGRYSSPSLTTLATNFRDIGVNAVNIWHFLDSHLSLDTAVRITVPSQLIIRGSTAHRAYQPARGEGDVQPPAGADYYSDPDIAPLMNLESCLMGLDELDRQILLEVVRGTSYEAISELLYTSLSSVRYRMKKIVGRAGAANRKALEKLLLHYLPGLSAP